MGRILRCSRKPAEIPFYIPEIGINVYTGEELAYCIKNNLYRISKAFFNPDLNRFLEKELGLSSLSSHLDQLLSRYGIYVTAGEIAFAVGDLDEREKAGLEKKILEFNSMFKEERQKLEADNLLHAGEILKAVEIYHRLTMTPEKLSTEKIGDIYLKLAYIALDDFAWQQAVNMFEKAYLALKQEKILKQILAVSFLNGHEEIPPFVEAKVSAKALNQWLEEFRRKEEQAEAGLDRDGYTTLSDKESEPDYEEILREWKGDFRKIHKTSCQTIEFSV